AGQLIMDVDANKGHRLLEPQELYLWDRICIQYAGQYFNFKKHKAGIRDLRAFLEANLRTDHEYRAELKRNVLSVLRRGLLMFGVLGSIYGGAIAAAIWPSQKNEIHVGWIEWFGPFIYLGLLFAFALSLRGLARTVYAVLFLFRIRRIERQIEQLD